MTPFERREYAWERLERFSRAFQHDLNNPLGAMAGYLDLVRSQMKPEEAMTDPKLSRLIVLLDGLKESADRMNEILEDAHRTWHPKFRTYQRFPLAQLREALQNSASEKMSLETEGEWPDVELMGDSEKLAAAVAGMAAETAYFAKVESARVTVRRVEAGGLAESTAADLPPELAARAVLEIRALLPGADLEDDVLDRLYYPLNLRTEKRTEGWQFGAGYYIVRKHDGGVSFQRSEEGLAICTCLMLPESSG